MSAPPKEPARIAGVVLAAGTSTRFVGDAPKQLLEVDGETLVHRASRLVLEAGLDPVLLVVGHQADRVRAAVADLPLRIVDNERYRQGQSTSVRAGLGPLTQETDVAGALFVPIDQPGLDHESLRRLVETADPDGSRIVVPTFAGRRGAPVLFGRRFFADLASIEGDRGGRQLLRRHRDAVVEVELSSAAPLHDVDSVEDLGPCPGNGTTP